ncbi:MAG: hypothetical protein CEE40_07695 [Chloroflexi bacterium B3_Chlor]|nr:MAG: hypothetical protein CEE40_07695 [Chloroflexi bacterium B3_Chlor]
MGDGGVVPHLPAQWDRILHHISHSTSRRMKLPTGVRRVRYINDWAAVCGLFVLTLLFFWKIALTNRILVGLDVFTYFYPYKAYAAEVIRQGSLPLWNPYLFMGVPFLANIQSATLYPLNLPFYWLAVPKMVSYSIVLHVFLGGAFTYLLGRRVLGFGAWGGFVAGTTFALGGFLAAQVEHINQLSVLVWLPLILWLFYLTYTSRGFLYPLLTGVVIGVQFLGGHAQSSYINLFVLGCYALYLSLGKRSEGALSAMRSRDTGRRVAGALGLFAGVVVLGGGLAAFQLLPTYELSRLSIRGAGLSFRQAVSFSLRPGLLPRSLLPSLEDSPFSEYIAYVGIVPLSLALLGIWRRGRRQQALFFIALSALGLFLALGVYNPLYYAFYRLLPGFNLFRAPARWVYLYALGMAVLAGLGVEELASLSGVLSVSRNRIALGVVSLGLLLVPLLLLDLPSPPVIVYWVTWMILGGAVLWLGLQSQRGARYLAVLASLVVLELLVASRYLAYNEATAPGAFSSMRTSVAHLLTDQGVHRFLSFSDGSFDPGDLREIQEMLKGQLPEEAVYDYLVATKQKELVTPNLSLLYRLQSIDGYDGGVLPLARYVEWQRLLLPEEEVSIDGRLQGRIPEIPRARLLNLFNVKYILTDKVYDIWVDGAYYDLAHRAVLSGEGPTELLLDDIPHFPTTAVGLVSYLVDGGDLEQGTGVAEITVTDGDGRGRSFVLRAGEDTAEGQYGAAVRQHQPARIVGQWRGNPAGNDYHTLLRWEDVIYPTNILVRFLTDHGQLRVRGITLIDERTGTHRALTVSTEGRYRLVHSGDVKIYENLDVLPRAFVVHRARVMQDDEEVIAALQEESFAPGMEVILSGEGPGLASEAEDGEDKVSILSYEPERVVIGTSLESAGYLVLTDPYYPGWRALVDGESAEILRADYYFRAVHLAEGEHVVELIYDPASFKIGVVVSLLAVLVVSGGLAWEQLRS